MKTQVSLFAVHLKTLWTLVYPQSALRRLWSTERMHRLISVFTGHTCNLVGNAVLRSYVKPMSRLISEPAHDKTYNKTCATREDSDQPAHPRRLIRVFVDRMCLPGCAFYSLRAIQRGINEIPCHLGWLYKLVWVFDGHTCLIVGFVVHWKTVSKRSYMTFLEDIIETNEVSLIT